MDFRVVMEFQRVYMVTLDAQSMMQLNITMQNVPTVFHTHGCQYQAVEQMTGSTVTFRVKRVVQTGEVIWPSPPVLGVVSSEDWYGALAGAPGAVAPEGEFMSGLGPAITQGLFVVALGIGAVAGAGALVAGKGRRAMGAAIGAGVGLAGALAYGQINKARQKDEEAAEAAKPAPLPAPLPQAPTWSGNDAPIGPGGIQLPGIVGWW